jgi:serine protease inhibitor
MPSIFSRLIKGTHEPPQRATSAETYTHPSTQFAFSLFETLKPGDRNLAISPYSARVVLAMLCEGSTGESRKSMMDTLRLDEYPDYVTNHFERLGRPLGFQLAAEIERRGLEMLTANSLRCNDGFALLSPTESYRLQTPTH